MNGDILIGVLIPFAGTALGSACVYFMKKGIGSKGSEGSHGVCKRRDGGRLDLESHHSGNGANRGIWKTEFPSCIDRILAGNPFSAAARHSHSSSAHEH